MIQELLIPVGIISIMGLVFGLGLAFASKKFEVKVDERVSQVRELMPGANCGACGQTGCDSFAENVVIGKCEVNGCPVGGNELAKKLSELLGVGLKEVAAKSARVMCNGTGSSCRIKYDYSGIQDCTAAANMHGGPSSCSYGCVGMGNCSRACPFGAIVMDDGVARVIQAKCTACGKCVSACPKKLIELVPAASEYTVTCSSLDKGNIVRKNCDAGCIGCGKCVKTCQSGAITLHGTLAKINPELCTNCGECMKVCPVGSINLFKCGFCTTDMKTA